MIRLSFRSLAAPLRPWAADLQQRSSVCSTCQALANLHRQQQQLHHHRDPRQQPLREAAVQTRQFQLYTAKHQGRQEGTETVKINPFDFRGTWTYTGPHGVDNWKRLYNKNCAGKFQSPIDLVPSAMKRDGKLQEFTFINFDKTDNVTCKLENNGHTAQVSYCTGDLRLSGGGLRSEYQVVQFHFHWGSDNSRGSEHTINGQSYPMEMHIVTFNQNYDNFSNALNYADGLAVLGVFIEATDDGENIAFTKLINALDKCRNPGDFEMLTPGPLISMMPLNTSHFYRYQGSLTTPPCSEVVTWTLFKDPVTMSDDQIQEFRRLKSVERDRNGKFKQMVDNYRPVQALHGRECKKNF